MFKMAETTIATASRFQRACPSSSGFHGLLITNLVFTDVKLGRGADATVFKVDWNGTVCAAKRLHEILLEDESPGGADKLIGNFEAECLTWSKLRHPGVVQFLGVYLERSSLLPVLIMEKMDTSLRSHLEGHSRENFPLDLKAFVLRQVTQALAYLHCKNPPLVHHDLSPNNVLLNVASFLAKVSDFGMSRAINPSSLTRKSSIKGTPAFMPPEALHHPPRYNESLDVFSFGNIIVSTLTHEWPNPGPPNLLQGDQIVGLSELQRREHYVVKFTAQEKQLFLPIVHQCLENRPDKRPSSVMLVRELRHIESSLPTSSHVAAPIEQLHQQLSAKEEECRQKDGVIREKVEELSKKDEGLRTAVEEKDAVIMEKDAALREKDEALMEKDAALMEKDAALMEKDAVLMEKDAALMEKDAALMEKDAALMEKDAALMEKEAELQYFRNAIKERDSNTPGMGKQLAAAPKVKHPLRDWRKLGECQKVIQHHPEGGMYRGVSVNSEGLVIVTDVGNECAHLLTKDGALVRSIGKGVLGSVLLGVAFDLKGNIWVTDWDTKKVVQLSQDGRLLQAIHHAGRESDHFIDPLSVSVSPEGLIYVCDRGNDRVTVHDEEGKFLFAFGSFGSGPGCFGGPNDVAFGSDGLVYVTDYGNRRVCVWSKEGTFRRDFKTKYLPTGIAATTDGHLLINASTSNNVMVFTLEGEPIHVFGEGGSYKARFVRHRGICVDDSGVVHVADSINRRVLVF